MMNDNERKQLALNHLVDRVFGAEAGAGRRGDVEWDEDKRSLEWRTENSYTLEELNEFRIAVRCTEMVVCPTENSDNPDEPGELVIECNKVGVFPWEQ